MKTLLLWAIRAYRFFLSPWIGNQCRFAPTCSHYAYEAIERFGAFRGSALALRRILRCHPWNPGGIDPVPERESGTPSDCKAGTCTGHAVGATDQ